MTAWLNAIEHFQQQRQACVLLTVVQTWGSTPREVGTKMVVSAKQIVGTIGGGTLEQQAIAEARQSLATHDTDDSLTYGWCQEWILGPDLGQCCGGMIKIYYEYLPVRPQTWLTILREILATHQPCRVLTEIDPTTRQILRKQVQSLSEPIDSSPTFLQTISGMLLLEEIIQPYLFTLVLCGAGHVGQALVHVLSQYPCRIIWLDNRADSFPAHDPPASQAIIQKCLVADPVSQVKQLPLNSHYLIMTHEHALDLELCAAILAREAVLSVGVIGSKTKAARFQHRLRDRGFSPAQLQRLHCPIGLAAIQSKHPAAIAIAVAAQLLTWHTANTPTPNPISSPLPSECRA